MSFILSLSKDFTKKTYIPFIVGSAKLGLLKDESDIDMVLEVSNWQKTLLLAGYRDLGEKSVRAKRREGSDPRWERPITEMLFTMAGLVIELGREKKSLNLGNVHAVPGARKPLIRFSLNGQKIELSVGNTAAVINTKWMQRKGLVCLVNFRFSILLSPISLCQDEIFWSLLRLTRRVFDLNGLTRIGRLSSYSVLCLLVDFLTERKVLTPLDQIVADLPLVTPDKVCSVEWDYRLPECLNFNWQNNQNPVSFFSEFTIWLAALDFTKVVYSRSGTLLPLDDFMAKTKLNSTIFHQSPLMVADPFELEHNVTGQISAKNLEKIVKILRAFQIRFKMNRFIGKST